MSRSIACARAAHSPRRRRPSRAPPVCLAAAAAHPRLRSPQPRSTCSSDCPLDLAPDEAHYWDWSRHLDWSYYSKGPLVAWLIRGELRAVRRRRVRSPARLPAVRVPAVSAMACSSRPSTCSRARRSAATGSRWRRSLLALTLPPCRAPAVLMTIDAPFLCCWAWALRVRPAGGRPAGGCGAGRRPGWSSASACWRSTRWCCSRRASGCSCSPTRTGGGMLLRPGFWVMVGLTAAGSAADPGLERGDTTGSAFRHVAWPGWRDVAAAEAAHRPGSRSLDFLAGQVGLLVGYWFVAWVAAAWSVPAGRTATRAVAFLWWMSVPVWLLFAAAAVEVAGPAELAGRGLRHRVGAGRRLGRPAGGRPAPRLPPARRRRASPPRSCVGVAVTVVARYPGTGPAASRASWPARRPTDDPAPIRKLDPTCRLRGWRRSPAEVDASATACGPKGREPRPRQDDWTMPGELGVLLPRAPEVYSFGPALGDRHSQYDLWRPNPVADAQAFRGRTFVYVGDRHSRTRTGCSTGSDPPVEVIASDGGIPVAAWKVWVCRGFRGFPADGRREAGYLRYSPGSRVNTGTGDAWAVGTVRANRARPVAAGRRSYGLRAGGDRVPAVPACGAYTLSRPGTDLQLRLEVADRTRPRPTGGQRRGCRATGLEQFTSSVRFGHPDPLSVTTSRMTCGRGRACRPSGTRPSTRRDRLRRVAARPPGRVTSSAIAAVDRR